MATPTFVTYFFDTANLQTGSLFLVGLCIVAFFVIAFMMARIDFKFTLMFIIPLLMAMSGYLLPMWVAGLIWILVISVGGYMAWSRVQERI